MLKNICNIKKMALEVKMQKKKNKVLLSIGSKIARSQDGSATG